MPKIDKSKYTKEEFQKIRDARRAEKAKQRSLKLQKEITESKSNPLPNTSSNTCFVLGNGVSRKGILPQELNVYGKIYGCNALYREYNPDYLVAVDVKMILEISKSGYQYNHHVWTNPNRAFAKIQGLNYFRPSKGWSSGPTALWLASQHAHKRVFILGFDFKGLDDGKRLNNVYADTNNYKKSSDGATFFGNWLRQTTTVVRENPFIDFYRVIMPDNYIPDELNKFNNLKHIFVEDFKKMFNLS